VLEAIALVVLAPLKTVVPYTILVDRQTGFVETLSGLETRSVTADAALTDALLAQYVVARESFDAATVSADYRRVALWSSDVARRDYLALMPAANPQSPFNIYPRGTVATARIKSVSILDDGTALVRFETVRRAGTGSAADADHRVATMRFRFSGAPMAIADRLVNPLGFQVYSYRVTQETPPVAREDDAAVPAGADAVADSAGEPAIVQQAGPPMMPAR
jgi:type IV secretion system protein VirB8